MNKEWEKNNFFSLDHSIISDFDQPKDDKTIENLSVVSYNPINDLLLHNDDKHTLPPLAIMADVPSDIEVMSRKSKDDMLD